MNVLSLTCIFVLGPPGDLARRKASISAHLSSNHPIYEELSAADTRDICTTFAQLWQTPARTRKTELRDRRCPDIGFDRMYRRISELALPWGLELVLLAWHEICTSTHCGLLGRTPPFPQVS